MVMALFLALAAIVAASFVLGYSLFFPWWRSSLGRALVLSKASMTVLLTIGALFAYGADMHNALYLVISILGVIGVIIANVAMLGELYTSWRDSAPDGEKV